MTTTRYWSWFIVPLLVATTVDAARQGPDVRLVEAAKRRDLGAVTALVRQKTAVDVRQGDGATALHWAVYWDDPDMVDLLIKAGANVNVANDLGVTPLMLACSEGVSAPVIERLLMAGADANVRLLAGESPLMTAARTGNVSGVRLLLAKGAAVDAKTSRGQTALMLAVAQKHPDVVKVLVEAGADVHARSESWMQLVNSAGNHYTDGDYWMAQGGSTALVFAAHQGDLESAKALIAGGANVNDTNAARITALIMAAHSNHAAVAEYLLERGADPNVADAQYTALHAAILRGNLGLAGKLLAYGANPDVRVTRGTPVRRHSTDWAISHWVVGATPLWLAARYLDLDMMRVLVAGGANPMLTRNGSTPLMAAFIGGQTRQPEYLAAPPRDPEEERRVVSGIVKYCFDLGMNVNATDETGSTALHLAASKGHPDVIPMLVQRGARLDTRNARGQTPLGVASGGNVVRDALNNILLDTSDQQKAAATLLRSLGATD